MFTSWAVVVWCVRCSDGIETVGPPAKSFSYLRVLQYVVVEWYYLPLGSNWLL